MKNTATWALLAVVFLLAGCSSKEIFFFPPAAGSFLAPPEPQRSEGLPDEAALPASPTAVPDLTTAATGVFAAATGPVVVAPAEGPEQRTVLRPVAYGAQQEHLLVKAEEPQREHISPYQTAPKGKKKAMVGTV